MNACQGLIDAISNVILDDSCACTHLAHAISLLHDSPANQGEWKRKDIVAALHKCVHAPQKAIFCDEGLRVDVCAQNWHCNARAALAMQLEAAVALAGREGAGLFSVQKHTNDQPVGSVELVEDIEDCVSLDTGRFILDVLSYIRCPCVSVPWTDTSVDARARLLLAKTATACSVKIKIVSQISLSSSAALMQSADKQLQGLLFSWCMEAMKCVKQTLFHQVDEDLDSAIQKSHEGPEAWCRSVCAYQYLAYVSTMQHPYLTEAVPMLLPALLAAFSDPLPFVKRCAAFALLHLAKHATAASLHWQREILLHVTMRTVSGCDASVWPAALPAALALADRLDAVDGGLAQQLHVMECIVSEVQRSGHHADTRHVFLAEVLQPLQRLGLQGVRFWGTLLPLMMEWLRIDTPEGKVLVIEVCLCMCRVAWPRMRAHANLVLEELADVQGELLRSSEAGASKALARVAALSDTLWLLSQPMES